MANLTGKALARARAGLEFVGLPQHTWITGDDCATTTPGFCKQPTCSCILPVPSASYKPGLHASWDCAQRFWKVLHACPGFFPDGNRDPAQWIGSNLAPAAKRAWVDLIALEEIPLPTNKNARVPPFHL